MRHGTWRGCHAQIRDELNQCLNKWISLVGTAVAGLGAKMFFKLQSAMGRLAGYNLASKDHKGAISGNSQNPSSAAACERVTVCEKREAGTEKVRRR